jgi:hypothetical protein
MTLLDAKQYDPVRERQRKVRIATVVFVVLVLAWMGWMYRNWPEEQVVARFFDALAQKNYEAAYGIWMQDPQWRQHPEKHSAYVFNDFYRDWGPGGEWGLIKAYKIDGSLNPKGGSSGVIVDVIVNDRAEHARVWVQKSDKTLSFSPY